MKSVDFGRCALGTCVAAAMLAACGGSQPPIGAPEAMPQNRAHGASGSPGDLIYAATYSFGVYMFAYPSGTYVGSLQVNAASSKGMCTDTSGNVYLLGYSGGNAYISKYAHGASKPKSKIGVLYDYDPHSCAVDPTTGNLAVYVEYIGAQDVIAIYPNASGLPTFYTIPDTEGAAQYCTYDDSGNLFADVYLGRRSATYGIAELPAGGSTFTILTLNKNRPLGPLQWVSSYLAAAHAGKIYHLAVSGSSVRLIGITKAQGKQLPTWIQDYDVLVGAYGKHSEELALWNYPQGGKPITIIPQLNKHFSDLNSVLVSVAPSL